MKTGVRLFDWRDALAAVPGAVSIPGEVTLLETPLIAPVFDHPFKIDVVTAVICERGEIRGQIDLTAMHTVGPAMIVVFPDRILRYEYISDDFRGRFIVMSKRFLESLDLDGSLQASARLRDNPCVRLGAEEMEAVLTYYEMLRRAIAVPDHPHKREIAVNLTRAFFYGAGYYFHSAASALSAAGAATAGRGEQLVEDFLALVRDNFRRERGLDFYAGRLSITPKYMSTVIGRTTGRTAGEWIDDHVMLEARALLRSTDMTISQIADTLGFPTQSFFGKYFKRLGGLSPKDYRNS